MKVCNLDTFHIGPVHLMAGFLLAMGWMAFSSNVSRAAQPRSQEFSPIAGGPFRASRESLKEYQCPEWFRDAKLGIWAHWGPQSVPMAGDWYARHLYVQGHPQYTHHLEHFGHPSKTGYKDIIALWKAEKWDPDRLMGLYQKAGARYFVSMAVHHDNFDLWDSRHNRWNAVKMGPHRDVVGDWQKAARKLGLKFGVSEHLGASFTWLQDSHKSDKMGPMAGVPYDGTDPRNEDLYHWPAAEGDTEWYSKDPRWHQQWFNRVRDLVDHYQPDLLYTDGAAPFGEVGLSLIAHLYNDSAARNGGAVQAVYTCKEKSEGRWVEDLERGVMPGIRPHPWQSDTSIGDWFYNQNWKYRGADWVIHMLVDIVSKNGNLLINIVQRPDGSLDPEAEKILEEMEAWTTINGEGIFETRPWLVHGEGPVRARGGNFKEDFAYTAGDLRFTSKGDKTLYAFAMGWPSDGKITVRSLARFPGVTGKILEVKLLGDPGPVDWTHDADGLTIELPSRKPCDHAVALKITGEDLRGFKPEMAPPAVSKVHADAGGSLTLLAEGAELHGGQINVEERGGQSNLGFWDRPEDWASWKIDVKKEGKRKVLISTASVENGAGLKLEIGGHTLEIKPPATGAWDHFAEFDAGTVDVPGPGEHGVSVRPADGQKWRPLNLRWIKLIAVDN